MVTNRGQWLILLGVAGSGVGLLLNKGLLAQASLAVLVWLFLEWLLFRWRVDRQIGFLSCERTVNGSADRSGTLWTTRPVQIRVQIRCDRSVRIPFVRFRDWIPENLQMDDGDGEWMRPFRARGLLNSVIHAEPVLLVLCSGVA